MPDPCIKLDLGHFAHSLHTLINSEDDIRRVNTCFWEGSVTIGWGLIGCGSIARRRILPAIREAGNSRLIAVMSRSIEKARRLASEYGAERYYDKVDDLLGDDEIDAIYIATPTFLHAPQTIMAAEAGKHILCEKPMAMNMDECLRMVEECRRNHVKLMIGHHLRFKPDSWGIRRIIADGTIGDVSLIKAQQSIWYNPDPTAWRVNPSLGGGGSLMDLGVHCIDLLRFILKSEVVEVAAFTQTLTFNYPVEDTAIVLIRFDRGAYGVIDSCFNIKHSRRVLEVYGSEGTIFGIGTISPKTGVVEVFIDGEKKTYKFEEKNPYVAEVEHFAECIAVSYTHLTLPTKA